MDLVPELQKRIEDTQSAANNFLSIIGIQSTIINFMSAISTSQSIDDLLHAIEVAATEFQLKICIRLVSDSDTTLFDPRGSIMELDEKLLNHLSLMQERFIEFQDRLIITYPQVNVLIKNLPKDEDKRSLVKDNWNIMVQSLNSKLDTLNASLEIKRQRQETAREILDILSALLQQVEHQFKDHSDSITQILKKMVDNLESAMISLGLEEDQEAFISNLTNQAILDLYASLDGGIKLETLSEDLIKDVRLLIND